MKPVPLVIPEEVMQIVHPFRRMTDTEIERLTNSINHTGKHYDIDTPLRLSHFIAQLIHESGCFRYVEEIWRDTAAQLGYEGRMDLGNTELGDGYRYRGRGYIQITGRKNYQQFKEATGLDVIANPEILTVSPYDMMSGGWFWSTRRLNRFADKDRGEDITYRVNGSRATHPKRQPIIDHVKKILL